MPFYETAVGALVFFSVVAIGGALLRARAARRQRLLARLREGPSAPLEPAAQGDRRGLVRAVGRLGMAVSSGSPSRTLSEKLAQAGIHGRSAAGVFLGAKVLLLVGGVAAATALLLPLNLALPLKVFCIVAAGALLSFLPNEFVRMRRRKRALEVRRVLPDVIDMLEICVSSGMGLDMAWNLVGDEIREVSPTIADEMALTNLEMHLGAPRMAAVRHMAQRTGADEIASLAAVLVQSERFGTSVADTLKTFAESMREERSMRAQEAAEKVPVKLLFPMVVFIFPAVIIVAAGPAAVVLSRMLMEK